MAGNKYICPSSKCKLGFASVASYAEHVKVHPHFKSKSKPKNCIPCCFGCDSRFSSTNSLQAHISKYHEADKRKSSKQSPPTVAGIKCPCCEEPLQSRSLYLKHVGSHLKANPNFEHLETVPEFLCPLCANGKQTLMKNLFQFRVHNARYHPEGNGDFASGSEEIAQCTLQGVFVVSPLSSDLEDSMRRDVDQSSNTESEGELPEDTRMDTLGFEENPYPENLIKDQVARYYLKLESRFMLPSKQVQDISEEIKLLSELTHHSIKKSLMEQMKNAGIDENVMNSILNEAFKSDPIFNIHHKHEDVEQLSSDHLRQKYYKENYPYIEPKQIKVGTDANGKSRYAHYVSIREGLNALLANDKVKKLVRKSFEPREASDILKDYTDGTAYAEHMEQHHGGKCLQILLFQDAFDFGAFGPTHGVYKINGFYYALGNLPAEYRSKVDSILMAYLLVEKDMKPSVQEEITDHDKLKEVLKPLIDELEDLKVNGIELDGEVIPVCLLFLIGDSLGHHTVGGFVKNFTSEFSCRFCTMSKTEFKEAPHLLKPLRTPVQYNNAVKTIKRKWIAKRNEILKKIHKSVKRLRRFSADSVLAQCSAPGMKTILKKNISKDSFKKLCSLNFQGVKYRPSPFNSDTLKFHVCSPAMVPCLSHDLHEGIVKLVLGKILKYFVEEKKWFDLETLNRRIKAFKCKGSDARDAPTVIKSFDHMSGNAVEMWNLLRLLPFIIGDLIQDEEDRMWKLYLLLKQITELVCAPRISKQQVAYLRSLIWSYLYLVKELLPDCLTPKTHWLNHYPDLIIYFGPLIRLFTLRFESKHVFFKTVGDACKSFKNITKTLSKKYMYRFAHDHSSDILPVSLEYDTSKSSPLDIENVPEEIAAVLPEDFPCDDVEDLQKVVVHSVEYQIGDVMVLDSTDNALDLEVGIIHKILLQDQLRVHFIFDQRKAVNSCHGFYCLDKSENKYTIQALDALPDYYPLPVYKFEGQNCITLKHSVTCMLN